jgi:predicted RNase H-like HicB family nuclease
MFRYTIIIEKAEGNYSAYCPDLSGCIATGRTEEETIHRMKEAIEFHIEGLQEEKASIPAPSTKAVSVDVVV